ncbi:Mu transposase C-terminal domain-containing protein [Leptolyngbya ohadii]|uniref:Mu transposase C-terminal domain-containing protein n=1 Tax=Leptolyngbya ohadii TaxID=1962290 RepID=UPI000B59DA74|nr:Mu transposase C-terminal domain-containing protein [Leptolyngbya ohadii]
MAAQPEENNQVPESLDSDSQEKTQEHPPLLLNEISPELQRKIDLIDAVMQASNKKARQEAIARAAQELGLTERTIRGLVRRVESGEGPAVLAVGRQDKGQFRIAEHWFKFIIATYEWGQKQGSRMNKHQVHRKLGTLAKLGEKLRDKRYRKLFMGHRKAREDLVAGEYPSHVTVYKVIDFYLKGKHKKVRHPGSPAEGQIIQTTEGILEITHSNQIWQCDHTKLDILVVDEKGDTILEIDDDGEEVWGRPYLTLIADSYSGCVVGFHLGLEPAGSHEVGLALRHAMLPKQYGPEYELEEKEIVFGKPEYWLTDRAKEFKSNHLQQISMQVGFKRRLRAFPQAGGLIETIFDTLNKELLSLLPGYTGSNVQDRPKDAEKYACITLKELEKLLVRYFFNTYNWLDYPRVEGQKRHERWRSMLLSEPEVLDERSLDVCLMKVSHRKVEKYGSVEFARLIYQGDCLIPYQGEEISLRYDERNITALLAYTRPAGGQPGQYIGVVRARDLKQDQISLEELRWYKRKLRKRGVKVDHDSIVAERMGLYEFIDEKRKSKRQRRKQANQEHQQQTNASTVVELFPQNQSVETPPDSQPDAEAFVSESQTEDRTNPPPPSQSVPEPLPPVDAPDSTVADLVGAEDASVVIVDEVSTPDESSDDSSLSNTVDFSHEPVVAYDWDQLLADNW